MEKRIKLSEKADDACTSIVEFEMVNTPGVTHYCSGDNWLKYAIIYDILECGATEENLKDLYSLGYDTGYEACEFNT